MSGDKTTVRTRRSVTNMCSTFQLMLLAIVCLSILMPTVTSYRNKQEMNIDLTMVSTWAKTFSRKLLAISKKLTAHQVLEDEYSSFLATTTRNGADMEYSSFLATTTRSGADMVGLMAQEIETMLSQKVVAIQKLKDEAERVYEDHIYDPHSLVNFDFPNNKKLLSDDDLIVMGPNTTSESIANKFRYLPLRKNLQFNNMLVNTTYSTVHVPTNVYDKSPPILNGVQWSNKLTSIFQQNSKMDHSMTWQYFCSSDGFFRVFPGMKWPRDNKDGNIDMFDCRMRNWYIKAATSPKNILLLVDTSGSMKGLRMEIARSTIGTLLDTLSDDDYFKIMNFSESADFADECFNDSMIRANTENKQRLKEVIQFLPNRRIANFQEAFENAFELFKHEELHRNITLCNKAIMLITDGAPENYEWIFDKYNWPDKSIRVFTYLIGREVSDNKQVKWMACANKGYYTHISTLADVQENVQKYVKVLSRPIVLTNFSNPIWTPIYMDHITETSDDKQQGLKFMTSVAVPVFDKNNKTKKEGNLLGVIGTDIPVREIKKFTAPYKLGPNAYAFAITHNGYVLFHPDFRPLYKTHGETNPQPSSDFGFAPFFMDQKEEGESKPILKDEYNSVELSEVVLAVEQQQLEEMQKHMLSHCKGSKRIKVKVPYDNMRRATVRQYSFYYARIRNTSFSLGIAIPSNHENSTVISASRTMSADYFNGNIELAPWQYCNDDNPIYVGRDRVNSIVNMESEFRDKNCDKELIQKLIMDAQCSCKFVEGILHPPSHKSSKKCQDEESMQQNETKLLKTLKREDVEMVFVGTGGGLTRYVTLENLTEQNFLKENVETVRSLYYQRAVEGRVEGGYLFSYSIPLGEGLNPNNTVVTGSAPIIVRDSENDKKQAVTAVVGLQMKYRRFSEMFFNITTKCQKGRDMNDYCRYNCSSPEINCYLLDNHGYVMLSKMPEHNLGRFFGAMEGDLMNEFIKRKIYIPIEMIDHQAMCPINNTHGSKRSSADALLNPLKCVYNMLIWAATELILFLSEWKLFNLMKIGNSVFGSEDMRQNFQAMNAEELEVYRSWEIRQLISAQKNKIIGYRPCKKNFTLYMADFDKFSRKKGKSSFYGTVTKCVTECQSPNESYIIHWIKDTNLLLVVADASCECSTINFELRFDTIEEFTTKVPTVGEKTAKKSRHQML